MSRIETIAISSIRTNGGTQPRAHLDRATVDEYAERMTDGVNLPPVVVFFDGTDHWLADGFHRLQASIQIKALSIEAEVHEGGQRDAKLYSFGANSAHGLPRSNADKRRVVEAMLADPEWSAWSDREIGRQCHVTHWLVARVREEASHLDVHPDRSQETVKSASRGGKTYEVDTSGVAESNKKRAKKKDTPVATPLEMPSTDSVTDPLAEERAALEHKQAELDETLEAASQAIAENTEMAKILDANDQLAEARASISRLTHQVRVLNDRVASLQNEKNEAARLTKYWRSRYEKLEKARAAES